MILNTGRVASQFFYINLKLQQDVIMPSRYQFDHVVKYWVKKRYKHPFKLFNQYRLDQLKKHPNSYFGTVFHSARRNLIYPLNSPRNIDFLKRCRDELELKTIFFPVREPDSVFRSELNRQFARQVGDWSFPEGLNDWTRKWALKDFDLLKVKELEHIDSSNFLTKKISENRLKDSSKSFIIERSKIYSLYELFLKVFDDIEVFDFDHVLKSPDKVFNRIANKVGFHLSDTTLLQTKLNSLSSRFMLYNKFIIMMDRKTKKLWSKEKNYKESIFEGKESFKNFFIGKKNPFFNYCRFRFEIPKVLSVCEDWGRYKQVAILKKNHLPLTSEALKSDIALGVHQDDLLYLNQFGISEVVKLISNIICPRFDKNFDIMFNFYKNNVYHNGPPTGDLYDSFIIENRDESQKINKILNKSDFIFS